MNKKTYIPQPMDTSDEILHENILELAEMLAKNSHEVWAFHRMEQGWSYGPCRDDTKKETPCMVVYEELPDSEKEYDRNLSLEMLKLIQMLGYSVIKKSK